jgi:hypothetical protein
MSRPERCRIAGEPADYQRYGIANGEIAAWEDGFRTRPGGPGTFEWWYFDAVLDDGSTLVINFMDKDIRAGSGIKQSARPVITFQLDRPDGSHVERALHAYDDFAFAADRCDVRVSACTFAGDLHTYRIHVELDAVTADVTLTGQVPSWRPATGHILFGDQRPHLFAWLPAVPQGAVQATLTVDGEIVADDSALVRFEKAGERRDPVTGKPVADITVYDYDATAHGGEHYRVTFRRDFTGQVTVERIGSDTAPETVTAPALWELMYFGKPRLDRHEQLVR